MPNGDALREVLKLVKKVECQIEMIFLRIKIHRIGDYISSRPNELLRGREILFCKVLNETQLCKEARREVLDCWEPSNVIFGDSFE